MNNYFDTEYFDFDKKSTTKSKQKKKQQQQLLLILLLAGAAAYYYFMIYLPEEETKQWENEIQKKLDKVKSLKVDDYGQITTLLGTCQGFLLWNTTGSETQKIALQNKKGSLEGAIKWLKENQLTSEKLENEHYRKGRIWDLPIKNWADKKLRDISGTLVTAYQEEVNLFPDGDKNPNFHFSRTASFTIYFPPSLKEHYENGMEAGETNCEMLKGKEDLVLSNDIVNWYKNTLTDPIRGQDDHENNALFYGMTRTGKSATVKNLCWEANKYPLIKIEGSSLTPRLKVAMNVLEKFQYTISYLEWTLEKTYGFEREPNGEIRYVLFVDECNQISNNAAFFESNKLQFVKECIEGNKSSRKGETDNLWIMATNHLEQIEEAVYQKGRLSNKLSFSWTWSEFKKICEKAGILSQIPQRWKDVGSLIEEEDKWVKKFNIPIFYKDFLGDDSQDLEKPKFWNLFITNQPDAILETEEDETDDDGKPTGQKVKIEIEIGEFLEYFWNLYESGNVKNYKGEFESLKQVKTEEVLESTLPSIDDSLVRSSNELNQSLENLRQEIEALKQQLQSSGMNSQLVTIQNNINTLFQHIGNLRAKVEK